MNSININERKPIWMALSEFYLDTELDDKDFGYIALTILKSPYNIDEVKNINKYEVFPVLQPNLLSTAGIWSGFDETWLVDKIALRIEKNIHRNNFWIELSYKLFGWMTKDNWKKIETAYDELKVQPDNYLIYCRLAYKNNIEPFQFDKDKNEIYLKIKEIVEKYAKQNKRDEFCQFLQEWQYYVNIWTAYFLIEEFDTHPEEILEFKKDEKIIDFCLSRIEEVLPYFKDEKQKESCRNWIEQQKTAYNTRL